MTHNRRYNPPAVWPSNRKKQQRKRTLKKLGPWKNWTEKEKRKALQAYTTGGIRAVQVLYPKAPPGATIRGWREQLARGPGQNIGRPARLTPQEEKHVLKALHDQRADGAVVDTEVVSILVDKVVKEIRGQRVEAVPLGTHWVKSFRRRHKIKGMASADRRGRHFFFFEEL